jgi:hypothetical protein
MLTWHVQACTAADHELLVMTLLHWSWLRCK